MDRIFPKLSLGFRNLLVTDFPWGISIDSLRLSGVRVDAVTASFWRCWQCCISNSWGLTGKGEERFACVYQLHVWGGLREGRLHNAYRVSYSKGLGLAVESAASGRKHVDIARGAGVRECMPYIPGSWSLFLWKKSCAYSEINCSYLVFLDSRKDVKRLWLFHLSLFAVIKLLCSVQVFELISKSVSW